MTKHPVIQKPRANTDILKHTKKGIRHFVNHVVPPSNDASMPSLMQFLGLLIFYSCKSSMLFKTNRTLFLTGSTFRCL